MLLENNTSPLKIGDTVIIAATNKVGRIIGKENGKWKVKIDGGPDMLKESSEIKQRQALFG